MRKASNRAFATSAAVMTRILALIRASGGRRTCSAKTFHPFRLSPVTTEA